MRALRSGGNRSIEPTISATASSNVDRCPRDVFFSVSRSRTTSDFDNRRRRDSASIWAIKDSGNRTVSVFIVPVYYTIGSSAIHTIAIRLSFTAWNRTQGRPQFPSMARGLRASAASFVAEKIGFVSQKRRGRLSALRLCRLPKPDAWSATVLVDELEARRTVGRSSFSTVIPVRSDDGSAYSVSTSSSLIPPPARRQFRGCPWARCIR